MNIQHDTENSRFVGELDGLFAVLRYQKVEDEQVIFTSTYVPFGLRGKGHAKEIVDVGLAWAKDNNLSVASTCWYVDKVLAGTE